MIIFFGKTTRFFEYRQGPRNQQLLSLLRHRGKGETKSKKNAPIVPRPVKCEPYFNPGSPFKFQLSRFALDSRPSAREVRSQLHLARRLHLRFLTTDYTSKTRMEEEKKSRDERREPSASEVGFSLHGAPSLSSASHQRIGTP
jgi:hypothetical protein